MKFLAVLTSPKDIFHGWSTWKTLWEEKFITVNMTSRERRNIKKNSDIKNVEQCIILYNSSKIGCLYKREVASSESKHYMGILM